MMTDDPLAAELTELKETIEVLTAGLHTMLKIQAQHGAALAEILGACTAPESDEPSPLVKLILKMNDGIGRIESALTAQ